MNKVLLLFIFLLSYWIVALTNEIGILYDLAGMNADANMTTNQIIQRVAKRLPKRVGI